MRMCWCTVMVRDLETSMEFYQEVLGLEPQRRYTTPEGLDIVFLSDGIMSEVELIQNPNAPAFEGGGICLGFEVDSLAYQMDRLKSLGIEIIRGPIETASGYKFFYVKDPDGLEIQLVEASQPRSANS